MKTWTIQFLIGEREEYHFITFKASTFSHEELNSELENCTLLGMPGLEVGETDENGLFIRNDVLWTKITKFWSSQDINSGVAHTLYFEPNKRIFTKHGFKIYVNLSL